MKRYIIFALLTISLGACQGYEGPTTASGIVVDRHTGQPVPNATVQVTGINSGLGAGGTSPGNTFPADAQGRFSLSFEASRDRNYTLLAYTASGYASGYGDAPLLTAGRKNDNLLVKTAAPAWVKITCVDDPPLAKVGLETWGYDGSGDRQNVGPSNFSFVRPIGSNSPGNISWRIADNRGNITEGKTSVNVANFDTATVTIHF